MTKKEYQRKWYLAHADTEREKSRERMTVYGPAHREQKRVYDRRYLDSKDGRKKIYARIDAYRSTEEGKFRSKARYTVSNAIRDGRLVRGVCEVCGAECAHAHHDDYSKPLEVRWLCRKHHIELHKKTVV